MTPALRTTPPTRQRGTRGRRRANRITTQRLRLRGWRGDDLPWFAAHHAENMAGTEGRRPPESAWGRLATRVGHWELRGYGEWAVEERKTGRLVGGVGLWFPDGWPELELGYWLRREMQGKGYATEAAARVRDYAFEVVGAETLVSYIHPDDEPSRRVAARLGALCEAGIELPDHGLYCVYRYPQPPTRWTLAAWR